MLDPKLRRMETQEAAGQSPSFKPAPVALFQILFKYFSEQVREPAATNCLTLTLLPFSRVKLSSGGLSV